VKTQEKSLGELLKQAGKVTAAQVAAALQEQKRTREPFGKVLVRLGFVTERDILQVLEGMLALTFTTGNEHFGIESYRIFEVVRRVPVRPLPLSNPQLAGVLSLRGEFHPVYTFRGILGLPPHPDPDRTWYIVLKHRGRPFILWVDSIEEVRRFRMEQVEALPPYLLGKRSDLYYCLGKMDNMLFSIIHPDRIVKDEELFQQAIGEAPRGDAS
jgi:chemotaxis signal transduction protein